MSISERCLRVCASEFQTKGWSTTLKAFLEAAGCSVRAVGEETLHVSIPRAPSDSQALREVGVYLKTWQAMNLEAHTLLIGEGETR
jgi:hypothetical protein